MASKRSFPDERRMLFSLLPQDIIHVVADYVYYSQGRKALTKLLLASNVRGYHWAEEHYIIMHNRFYPDERLTQQQARCSLTRLRAIQRVRGILLEDHPTRCSVCAVASKRAHPRRLHPGTLDGGQHRCLSLVLGLTLRRRNPRVPFERGWCETRFETMSELASPGSTVACIRSRGRPSAEREP